MENTCIEILLASYNGEKYIRTQIDSVLQQTENRWHLTISDDGSTDGTAEIIDEYVRQYPQKITRICSGRRFGNARDHFFWLIGQCGAKYIFTCDQDDRWIPEKVQRTMEEMEKAETSLAKDTPILVFTDQTPTDAQLRALAPSLMRYQNQYFEHFDYRSILMQNVVTGGAMCINRALADLAMQCKNPAQSIMHDWWIAAVAARFGRIVYIDEPLSDYRQHGTNSVGAKDVRSLSHIAYKIAHLDEIRKTLIEKKEQASLFLKTYGEMLGDEDDAFLKQYIKRRSGPMLYWKNRTLIHGSFRLLGMMVLG